jgi:hypothetical protein
VPLVEGVFIDKVCASHLANPSWQGSSSRNVIAVSQLQGKTSRSARARPSPVSPSCFKHSTHPFGVFAQALHAAKLLRIPGAAIVRDAGGERPSSLARAHPDRSIAVQDREQAKPSSRRIQPDQRNPDPGFSCRRLAMSLASGKTPPTKLLGLARPPRPRTAPILIRSASLSVRL